MNDYFSSFILPPSALVLLFALALDLLRGEPPNALHPVVWMGRWIGGWERRAPTRRPLIACVYGAVVVLAGLSLLLLFAIATQSLLQQWQPVAYLLVSAWLLKTTFAVRALLRAALAVQAALRDGNLSAARRLVSWHLVSRDTTTLDSALVAAATIESVAENFSDSFVAPLFYFALFGLPGAMAYRFTNTADAMLGYHDARREYLGKFAARLDDALNWIPARLAALMLIVAAVLTRANAAQAWRVMWRDHARTASPNAGWPMSAMAGALGVTLEKVGHYRLGDGGGELNADAIGHSLRVVGAACICSVTLIALLLILR